jgi:GT2 family glycosyltransferase
MLKPPTPLVCVVICNFNKRDDVLVAIESVQASTGVALEIVVVDNCSTDGSAQAIRDLQYKNVRVIDLPENIGGSGGFKVGMEASLRSQAEFVLLLDNDASVAPDTIAGLVDAMNNDLELGAVGPAILKAYSPGEIQDVGGFLSSEFFSHWPGFNSLPIDDLSLPPLYCEYLAACCLLTRRSVIEEVGSFDESFFIYWDDVDWCTRVRNAGYRLKVFPELRSWHKGGIQTATSTVPTYYNMRNRVRFFSRYPNLWPYDLAIAGIRKNMFEIFLGCLIKGDTHYIEANLEGFNDGLINDFKPVPMEILRNRKPAGATPLTLTQGNTYAIEFSDWFYRDTHEISRLNDNFNDGDLYKLSRILGFLKQTKSKYQVRFIVCPQFFLSLNRIEATILSRFVEVIPPPQSIEKITVVRHISDTIPENLSDSTFVDSYLNTNVSDFEILRDNALKAANLSPLAQQRIN